jgi:signal transduction histidine kinase
MAIFAFANTFIMNDTNHIDIRYRLLTPLLLLIAVLTGGCSEMAPTHEVRSVDSLNTLSHGAMYRDADSAMLYATQALDASSLYGQGKAEASNNIAYCHFVKTEFDKAEEIYNRVHRYTQNEPELLIADIGLMQICQRTARNKKYYDHRNSALQRMKRIDEDKSLFYERREKSRLNYAYTEFRLISALYHYNLRQRQEALSELNCIDPAELAANDAAQYMRYLHLRGLAGMSGNEGNETERTLSEFDNQFRLYQMATDSNYIYLVGEGLHGIADIMSVRSDYRLIASHRPEAIAALQAKYAGGFALSDTALQIKPEESDSLLPLQLGEESLKAFEQYKSNYGITAAYVSISQYYNETGRYEEADSTLQLALQTADIRTPEWISAIHEQMSVAFAGMDMKRESDHHRNIYLDLLNSTRQDRELESRYASLEEESNKLTIILLAVIAAFAVMMTSLVYLNRRTRRQGEAYTAKLRKALALCSDITSHRDIATDDIDTDVKRLLTPFIEWAERNEQNSDMLTEEREQLEAQRYLFERHIDEDKRQNIVRKACLALVYGVTPYIDRMINEIDKLLGKGYINDQRLKQEKFQYIGELADTINEQNEILSRWIKMRQGAIQLNIESFHLDELFTLLQKGRRSFELKNQKLDVDPTDCIVRADKALTLFMLNTLMENARKYTPEGGHIHVYATSADNYVELSVSDTGIGLSAEDIDTLLNSKVYDSKAIGANDESHRDYLMGNKGSGFGLMNCKGIIEKYRKTNRLFSICTFGIESHQGSGSRFYFRLPQGVVKALTMMLLALLPLTSCRNHNATAESDCNYSSTSDPAYTILLDSASLYADSVYYSNVERNHEQALVYARKAIELLNRHYQAYSNDTHGQLLKLTDNGVPAEFTWWAADFDTDYHVILDLRNEAAVAFLALKRLDGYRYNNEAYAGMYKLQGKDTTIESYCSELERSATNKTIGIVLCIALLVLSAVAYYLLFIRKRVVEVINLRQLLEVNRRAFAASQACPSAEAEALQLEEQTLHNIPQRIVDETFESINDLLDINTLGIAVFNDETTARPVYVSAGLGSGSEMPEIVSRCHATRTMIVEADMVAIPLTAEADDERCIGVFHLRLADASPSENSLLFAELVAKYFAIIIYNSVICPAVQYRDIEAAHEEVHRASWENSMLHVQNLVLDNCLSTIKHETIYYPSRIKNIVDNLQTSPTDERQRVEDISELAKYYRSIFAILYSCASRQLEEVTFRRTTIRVNDICDHCAKYFNKRKRSMKAELDLTVESLDSSVIGDRISLFFLTESLIDEALTLDAAGTLKLKAVKEGHYIRFTFTDNRRTKSADELNKLFTPELRRMSESGDRLSGTEYLICKQIIREHDEYAGRRGCRINAELADESGFSVYFTIPAATRSDSVSEEKE